MNRVVLSYCLYCDAPVKKGHKYCSAKCGKLYRRHKLNKVDFQKFDLNRRLKNCEVCNKLFVDNSNSLTRLHCSISCQNHKYYYENREQNIARGKEYRLLYPEKVKETNKKSREKSKDKHKEYMKAWHNVRKSLKKYNQES